MEETRREREVLTEDEDVGAVLEVESPPPRLVRLVGLGRLLLELSRLADLDDTVLAVPTAPSDGGFDDRVLALARYLGGVPGREEARELGRVDDLGGVLDNCYRTRRLSSRSET